MALKSPELNDILFKEQKEIIEDLKKTIELINEQLKINSKALALAAIAYFTGGASAGAGDSPVSAVTNLITGQGIPSPPFPYQIRLSATSSLNLSFNTPQQVAGKTSLPEGVIIGYTFLELLSLLLNRQIFKAYADYTLRKKDKWQAQRDFFHLESGWALKSKQKSEGDVDKSKRFTAASMLECLKSKVEEGELDKDEIPKLQTIQGWIARYSAQHHQKIAEKSIEISSNNYPELDKQYST
ncbi:hypothetical protein C2G38_2224882 [Gigaspora rosea]|uniref:Uncharacterized protein n=1 Tax=Gigaspora rosea TaxID=44941 RepID=A0A397U2W2_9GLOM|nr:hypothetical protein C2G38_2224882 [Gigaspora rosea]